MYICLFDKVALVTWFLLTQILLIIKDRRVFIHQLTHSTLSLYGRLLGERICLLIQLLEFQF